jgi:hypothetical protein
MNALELLLFPGILFHELSHYATCILLGVKVGKLKPTSVTHEKTTPWKNFLISFAPFIFGTAVGAVLLWVGHTGLKNALIPTTTDYAMIGFFYWLGFALISFCFPSETDATNAITTLFEFYEQGLTLKKGRFVWLFCLATMLPIFVPLAAISAVMSFFASVSGLGLLWAVTLFLGIGFHVGVW